MKTTAVDFDQLAAYLRNQVGWTEIAQVKRAIPAKHAHAFKIEAMRFVGLLDRDGANVKLTPEGREYAAGDEARRAQIMALRLKDIPLYNATLEWIHYHGKETVSKTDVAVYWHDNHAEETSGAVGDALTDAAVFFMRMAGIARLAKFVPAGGNRDTHLKVDAAALAEFVTGQPDASGAAEGAAQQNGKTDRTPPRPAPATTGRPLVEAGLNVRVEIHIAADATPSTIEEIFKNMRKYLLPQPETTDGS